MKKIILIIFISALIFSCKRTESFECPCGGYGIVAHGSIITIEEKNPGDTKRVLDAIENEFGGECCYYGEN